MTLTYYIDGYNVIHQCKGLSELVRKDFEGARDALIERVARYCTNTGAHARIVFDGRGRGHEPDPAVRRWPGIDVIFSPAHQSADAYIEREVYLAKPRTSVCVVSGDRGIRDLCGGMGALVMAPKHFLSAVDESLHQSSAALRTRAQRHKSSPVSDRLSASSMKRLEKIRKKLPK